MRRIIAYLIPMFLVTGTVGAGEPTKEGDKVLSGMSIVGNDEAPKSLVIVPWKSSDLGDTLNVSQAMDDGRGAVDRDVFMRALDYYQIRKGTREGPGPGSQ